MVGSVIPFKLSPLDIFISFPFPLLHQTLTIVHHPNHQDTPLTNTRKQLPNRTQYKHVIFAPQAWAGYEAAYFPGIRDAVDDGNWTLAREQVDKVAGILGRAARKLNN